MNSFANQKRAYSMAWSPAPVRRLPAPVLKGSSAFLAWGLGTRKNNWSTFWWVVSGIAFVKLLHDTSRM
jgi:hypothetical protein